MALQRLGASGDPHIWMIISGVVGAIIAALVMDWTLIVLSSVVGAAAIANSLPLGPTIQLLVFGVLAVIGTIVQGAMNRRPQVGRETSS